MNAAKPPGDAEPSASIGPAPLLSIVVLAFNEEDNLPAQLEACTAWFDLLQTRPAGIWPRGAAEGIAPETPVGEVVVVDDGSTDGTFAVAEAWCRRDARIRVVRHATNRGMGAVIRSGYAAARGRFVTQLPADCQVTPEVFDRFLPHLDSVDLVLSVYRHRDDGAKRSLMSRVFQALVWTLYRKDGRITGTMVIRRSVMELFDIHSDTFFANLELPFRILEAGVPHEVVEIESRPRRSGTSKVANSRRIARVVREMLRVRVRHWSD